MLLWFQGGDRVRVDQHGVRGLRAADVADDHPRESAVPAGHGQERAAPEPLQSLRRAQLQAQLHRRRAEGATSHLSPW